MSILKWAFLQGYMSKQAASLGDVVKSVSDSLLPASTYAAKQPDWEWDRQIRKNTPFEAGNGQIMSPMDKGRVEYAKKANRERWAPKGKAAKMPTPATTPAKMPTPKLNKTAAGVLDVTSEQKAPVTQQPSATQPPKDTKQTAQQPAQTQPPKAPQIDLTPGATAVNKLKPASIGQQTKEQLSIGGKQTASAK